MESRVRRVEFTCVLTCVLQDPHAGVEGRGLKGGTEADQDELTATNGPMAAIPSLEIRLGPIPSANFLQTLQESPLPQKSRSCPFPEQLIRFLHDAPEAPNSPQGNRENQV